MSTLDEVIAGMADSLIADQQAEIDAAATAIKELEERHQSELQAWQQRADVAQAAVDEIKAFLDWRDTKAQAAQAVRP